MKTDRVNLSRPSITQGRTPLFPRALLLILIVAIAASCGKSEPDRRKLAQIAVWEDEGWTADGQLTRMLFDGDATVRVRAALALARVNDTLANDSIAIALKKDKDPGVRKMAAFALGIDRWRKGGADLIEALGKEKNPEVIVEILQACGRVYTRDQYESILPFLRHSDPRVREQTLITLDLLNRHDIADSLHPLLADSNWRVQWAALFALNRAKDSLAAVSAIPLCKDTSATVRRAALRVVGVSNSEAANAVLFEGLQDTVAEVRAAAAEAFSRRIDTIRVLNLLPYLESESDPRVLKSLLASLTEHWRPQAEPHYKKLLSHPDPGVRAGAINALSRRVDFDFTGRITPAASDPHPAVRIAYLETIDQMSKYTTLDTSTFIRHVRRLTTDSVPRVRARAVQSYLTYDGAGALDVLNRLFNDPDPACLHMAINLIGSFRIPFYQDSLHSLYQKVRDVWRPDLKWAIIAASANMSPSIHPDSVRREIFEWGMADPNRHVRWYTIAVWEKFRQDRRHELGTYKTDLTVETANEILHPHRTNPTARLVTTRGVITLELLEDQTPRYVRRFIQLAQEGVYDNSPVNDIQPGGVIHMGDTRGDGFGMPGISVRDEFRPDRFNAGDVLWLINTRDAGMGLFAISMDRNPYLDWRYGSFARVIDGMDVARDLRLTDTLKTVEIVLPAT